MTFYLIFFNIKTALCLVKLFLFIYYFCFVILVLNKFPADQVTSKNCNFIQSTICLCIQKGKEKLKSKRKEKNKRQKK